MLKEFHTKQSSEHFIKKGHGLVKFFQMKTKRISYNKNTNKNK